MVGQYGSSYLGNDLVICLAVKQNKEDSMVDTVH